MEPEKSVNVAAEVSIRALPPYSSFLRVFPIGVCGETSECCLLGMTGFNHMSVLGGKGRVIWMTEFVFVAIGNPNSFKIMISSTPIFLSISQSDLG